jgi:hypothetical protein
MFIINNRCREERINDYEDRTMSIDQSEKQRQIDWDYKKRFNFDVIIVPKEDKKENPHSKKKELEK